MHGGIPIAMKLAFVANLRSHGTRPALLAGDDCVTYADLADRVADVAARLGPARRLVLIVGGNRMSAISTYLGSLAGGHAVLLTGPDTGTVGTLCDRYQPDVIVHGSDDWRRTAPSGRRPVELHPDLALVLSTSGSTGTPKTVRLSHRNLDSNAEAIAEYLSLDDTDCAVTSLPLHYCYGLSVIHSHLHVGASLVLSENSVLDACFWRDVQTHGVTSIAGVPHTFDLLDRAGFADMSVPTLRRLTQAGGPMSPDTVRRYAELGARSGWELFVMYGQTEATARMAYLPPRLASEHPDSIGVPIPGGSIRLAPVDDAPEDVGEIVYSGPNVMMGYAESNDDLQLGHTIEELRTGDLARRNHDGLYRIVGRTSRFAKLFGLRIDLDHVEALVAKSGSDAVCTEGDNGLVIAVVGGSAEHIRDELAAQLALPRSSIEVVVVPEIPRHPNGKVDFVAVKGLVHLRQDPSGSTGGNDGRRVRHVFAAALGVAQPQYDETFVSLGGDSLSYIEVAVGLEEIIGQLPDQWHTLSISELEQLDHEPRNPAFARIDSTVVLRAVAIAAIVGSHAALFRLRGGAHVLLAVAGFNFARFHLDSGSSRALLARTVRSMTRIAVPSALWLGALAIVSSDYGWQSVALLNTYLGPREWSPAWRYWFLEAVVLSILALTAFVSIPAIRRLEHAHRVGFPCALLAAGLMFRFDLVGLPGTPEPLLAPHRVLWFFILGWLIQRTTSTAGRVLTTAVALTTVPGFFGEPSRDAVVLAGLLLLIWVPYVSVPRPLARLAAPLAAASLYIYLTHFQIYLPLQQHNTPAWASVTVSLAVGAALWFSVHAVTTRFALFKQRAMGRLPEDVTRFARRSSSSTRLPPTCETENGLEAIRRSRPVPLDGLGTGGVQHRAHDERYHDDVVGIPDDRNEVGNEVDRRHQIGQQQPESHSDTS
jgi:acyl-CoA synthetase (AMP-forming)/AMP-acid ligase II